MLFRIHYLFKSVAGTEYKSIVGRAGTRTHEGLPLSLLSDGVLVLEGVQRNNVFITRDVSIITPFPIFEEIKFVFPV